jgi:ketosteroid isomerase-like protein
VELESAVREMADREAIRDLACRYAHCVWQKDAVGATELFTEDGVMDTGDRPPLEGREIMLESYRQMLEESELRPFVHNHVIELAGDRAAGTCYLDLHAVIDGKPMTGLGHYEDQYARVEGQWKFRSRKLNMCQLTEAPAAVTS